MSQNPETSVGSGTPRMEPTTRWKPLRVWPSVLLLVGMVVLRLVASLLEDGPPMIWILPVMGPALCGLLVLVWWLALSRATWRERLAGFFGSVTLIVVTIYFADPSMRGPATMVMTIPMGTAALAIGAICCSRLLSFRRTMIALLLATLAFSCSTLVRADGLWGNFALGLHWRWTTSPERALLDSVASQPRSEQKITNATEVFAHPEWPAFRGPRCDGRQLDVNIAADWKSEPPKLIWKVAVGPGWSSFSVAGNFLFTQEQRGTLEAVVCYAADTGKEVWIQQVESRFDDPLGGPGPRATPTLADGSIYVTFATGHVMKLDPATGEIIWKQDLRKVADRETLPFGFSSSPLVVGSLVIVYAGGKDDKGILAFNTETGQLQWSGSCGDHSYSTAQLATVLNEPVILMLTNSGLNVFDPVTGKDRLNYEWPFGPYRSVQPQVIGGDSVLIPSGMGLGTRLVRLSKLAERFEAKEVWTSRNLKPDFNDFVIHQGHAYGFDGSLFTCIELEGGQRKWKGGRYGKGQVLLLEQSGLLLIQGEQGEVALVKVDPAAYAEVALFQAIEGKTWNHPVVVGDRLFVRNSQEAASYRLALAKAPPPDENAGK